MSPLVMPAGQDDAQASPAEPRNIAEIIKRAHSIKFTLEDKEYLAGDLYVDRLIASGCTILETFRIKHDRVRLYNPGTGFKLVVFPHGQMHNYMKVAIEMLQRGGKLETHEDVEWALLKGIPVPQEVLIGFPNLIERFGVQSSP